VGGGGAQTREGELKNKGQATKLVFRCKVIKGYKDPMDKFRVWGKLAKSMQCSGVGGEEEEKKKNRSQELLHNKREKKESLTKTWSRRRV